MSTNANERGFTIIETLVAMVILTIALVSLAELMAVTLHLQMQGRNETSAVRLAQSKIDELVAVNFTDPNVAVGGSVTSDVAGYFTIVGSTTATQAFASNNQIGGYKIRWQIAAIAGETSIRTLTVRVIPNTNDRRSSAEVELTTIIRNPADLS